MEEDDANVFLQELQHATRYLEYGGGGSTIIAARQGLSTVCIESDKKFLTAISNKIQPIDHNVILHYADIGITGRWGRPIKLLSTRRSRQRYPDYVYAPNQYVQDTFFDLVLIDGRFRVACALYIFLRALTLDIQPLVCFDDYARRTMYQAVTQFCKPDWVGTYMALFRPNKESMLRMPSDDDIRFFCRQSM